MLKTLALVEASRDPSQAKGRIARRLGGHSLLEWVVRRVTDCQRLDGVVVLCTPDQAWIQDLVPPDVPVFISRQPDALGRFVAAAKALDAEALVRVSSDNPLVDHALIDPLLAAAEEGGSCDYVGYRSRDGRPAVASSPGIFAEWCRVDALKQADREATSSYDRNQVTSFLYNDPQRFELRLLAPPRELAGEEIPWTFDFEQVWEGAETIVDALGHDACDWRRIAGLYRSQPVLAKADGLQDN
jgi:spore coat polysaccharide biosynthesis protein SpsF